MPSKSRCVISGAWQLAGTVRAKKAGLQLYMLNLWMITLRLP